MAIAEAILAKGGVVWPVDVMEWQRAERQDRPLPGRECAKIAASFPGLTSQPD